MKRKLAVLLSVLAVALMVGAPTAKAIGVSIAVGDRPYYEGPEFWDWGWHYVWVPGHMVHGHWVRGYYIRQGEWSHRHLHHRHHWHHHD